MCSCIIDIIRMLRSTGSQFGKSFTPAPRKQSQFGDCASEMQKLNPLRIMVALKNIVKLQNGRKLWQKSSRSPNNDQSNYNKHRNIKNNNIYLSKTPPISKQYETTNHRERIIKRHSHNSQQSQPLYGEQQLEQFPIKAKNSSTTPYVIYEINNKNQVKWDVNNYDRAITECKQSIEQRARKMSIKTRLQPVFYHQKTEQPEAMISLINKFKFQNLKIMPFPNNNSDQIVQTDNQINEPQLIKTKKSHPSFFKCPCKEAEKKITIFNKSINKDFCKSKSREQTKKLSGTFPKTNLLKTSIPIISPWMTLSDQFSTHQLLEQ